MLAWLVKSRLKIVVAYGEKVLTRNKNTGKAKNNEYTNKKLGNKLAARENDTDKQTIFIKDQYIQQWPYALRS